MRLLVILFLFKLIPPAGSQVITKNFTLLAYRQKIVSGVAPGNFSTIPTAQFQYFIFISPNKASKPVKVKKLCLNGQRYLAELELLDRPFIVEQKMNPDESRRDTLTPVRFLPAYKVNFKKPDLIPSPQKRINKQIVLALWLNIGKARIKNWTELPDLINP